MPAAKSWTLPNFSSYSRAPRWPNPLRSQCRKRPCPRLKRRLRANPRRRACPTITTVKPFDDPTHDREVGQRNATRDTTRIDDTRIDAKQDKQAA